MSSAPRAWWDTISGGNPGITTTSPLAVLLAVPFVPIVARRTRRSSGCPSSWWSRGRATGWRLDEVLLPWTLLALSSTVIVGIVTRGDLLANGPYALVFTLLLIRVAPHRPGPAAPATVLLGLGLSSRPNLVLLLPPLFVHLREHAGLRSTVRYTGMACTAAAIVTLPSYLHPPYDFTPLHAAGSFSSTMPGTQIVVPIPARLLTLWSPGRLADGAGVALCGRFARVGFLFVPVLLVLRSATAGSVVAGPLHYGRRFLAFGAFAAFSSEQPSAGRSSDLRATPPLRVGRNSGSMNTPP